MGEQSVDGSADDIGSVSSEETGSPPRRIETSDDGPSRGAAESGGFLHPSRWLARPQDGSQPSVRADAQALVAQRGAALPRCAAAARTSPQPASWGDRLHGDGSSAQATKAGFCRTYDKPLGLCRAKHSGLWSAANPQQTDSEARFRANLRKVALGLPWTIPDRRRDDVVITKSNRPPGGKSERLSAAFIAQRRPTLGFWAG